MLLKYTIIMSLLFVGMIKSFNSKIYIQQNKIFYLNMMKPTDMLKYLTSIKDYTIITVGDKNRNIEELMYKNNMNVYYVNLNNIFDKNEIITILETKYKYFYNNEYLWFFYRGNFIGTREDIYKMIENKQKNSLF